MFGFPGPSSDGGYHCRVKKRVENTAQGGSGGRVWREVLPAFDRRVWLLLAAMLVFRFGQGLYYPFSTIYFHNVVGIPLSLIGVGLGTLAASSVVSGLISGPLADRHGRKPLVLLALSGNATTFLAFAFVGGFWGYLAVCVLAGLAGASMFDAARNAMVADVTPGHVRARAYGLVRVGGNVGWALGPLAAGGLAASAAASGGAYRAMFVGASALTLVVLCALALGLRESLPGAGTKEAAPSRAVPVSKLRAAFADGRFVALLVVGFLLYYIFTQDWQALPVYSKNFLGLSDAEVGFFLAGNGLMVVVLQLPVSYLLDGRSKVAALGAGSALFAASSATLLLADGFWGVLLAFAGFFTLGEMILEVAGASLAAELAPEERRGTYLALFGACFGASYGLSPVVAGTLLDAGIPTAIWTIQLVAATLAAFALLRLSALKRRRSARDERPETG